jgi:sugar diacid utilization regulator
MDPQHKLDVDAFRNDVVRRLQDSLDELVETMFAAMLDRIPPYRDLDPAELEDIRSGVRRAAGFFLRGMAEDRKLERNEVAALHVIGAQRARQGIAREHMVNSVQVAMEAGYAYLMGRAAEPEAPPETAVAGLGQMSLRLFSFLKDFTEALTAGYLEEQEQRLTSKVRAQAALVDRLLEGSWTDEEEVRAHAQQLGYEITTPCGLLLVLPVAERETAKLRPAAASIAGASPSLIEGPTRSIRSPHVVLLAPSRSGQPWAVLLDAVRTSAEEAGVVVVAADPVDRLSDLSIAYGRAERDISLAHAARRDAGLVSATDLRLYRVLSGADAADRLDFVDQVLGPVIRAGERKGVELMETLEALWSNRGRIVAVAAALRIHEKTVRYRLRNIQDLTGLRLDVPPDRLQIDVALRLRRLAAAEAWALANPAWDVPPDPLLQDG